MVIDSAGRLSNLDCHDQRHPTPRRVPDRMAGRAFAFAADPPLLAAHARHRRRLRHRGGAARRVQGFHSPAVAARLRRRQRHHSAQGARAGAVEAGCARACGRCGQYVVVREWRTVLDQYRCRRFHQQPRRRRARMGPLRGCAGARRRRFVAGRRIRPARPRHRARASRQPHHRARPVAGGSVWRTGSACCLG